MYNSLTIEFEDGTEKTVLFVKSFSITNNVLKIDAKDGEKYICNFDKILSIFIKPVPVI